MLKDTNSLDAAQILKFSLSLAVLWIQAMLYGSGDIYILHVLTLIILSGNTNLFWNPCWSGEKSLFLHINIFFTV